MRPRHMSTASCGAVVGVELVVERVEAKAELSQNRSLGDRQGAIDCREATETSTRAQARPHVPRRVSDRHCR